jgi:hypothetical protein
MSRRPFSPPTTLSPPSFSPPPEIGKQKMTTGSVNDSLTIVHRQLASATKQIDALKLLISDNQTLGDSLDKPFSLPSFAEPLWSEKLSSAISTLSQAVDSLSLLSVPSMDKFEVKFRTRERVLSCESKNYKKPLPFLSLFSHSQPSDIVSIMKVQSLVRRWLARRRRNLILIERELIESENRYVSNLFVLISKFLIPLRARQPSLLTKEQENAIFGLPILEDLHRSHIFFLSMLTNSFTKNLCLGDLFSDAADFLRNYIPYVTNFDLAMKTLTTALQDHTFKRFVRTSQSHKECHNHDLQSFLILPIQRIPRYVLLLTQMLKYSSPRYTQSFRNALTKVDGICREINLHKKVNDNSCRIAELQLLLKGKKVNLSESWILKEGPVSVSALRTKITATSLGDSSLSFVRWLSLCEELTPHQPVAKKLSSSLAASATQHDFLTISSSPDNNKLHPRSSHRSRNRQSTVSILNEKSPTVSVYLIGTSKYLLFCRPVADIGAAIHSHVNLRYKLKCKSILHVYLKEEKLFLQLSEVLFIIQGQTSLDTKSWFISLTGDVSNSPTKKKRIKSTPVVHHNHYTTNPTPPATFAISTAARNLAQRIQDQDLPS